MKIMNNQASITRVNNLAANETDKELITIANKLTNLMDAVVERKVRQPLAEKVIMYYSIAIFHKTVRALSLDAARYILSV